MYFSVVIPLYNKERHIRRAIESILKQSYQQFEIIIVDDGSTDSSIEQVKKISDPRIRLIRQKNQGVSAARNKGISEAKYELVAFLDADDAWKVNFLETILRLRLKYPEAGAYATAYEFKRPNGKTVEAEYNAIPHKGWEGIIDNYFKASIKNQLIWSSAVVIPKNVFEHVGGFPVGISRGEDLDMWCRVALNYKIAFSNNVCATYFQDADNRACNKKVDYSQSFISRAEDLYLKYKQTENYSFYFEEYMIKIFISKAKYFIETGKNKEARKLLNKHKHTKFHKKLLIFTYISSYVPNFFVEAVYFIRNLIK